MTAGPRNLEHLRRKASLPSPAPRVALHYHGRPFGSVSHPLAAALLQTGPPGLRGSLSALELTGVPAAALAALAGWLRDHGHAGAWRNEQLAVRNESGAQIGTIERAAVRPLGIATQAVHLVGTTADGRIWLQQRALSKATDPGKWDTLMGGMIAAGESLHDALTRETWEETGLRLDALGGLAAIHGHGAVTIRRPVADSGTGGYMIERIHALACVIPEGLEPQNQDGEAMGFERVTPATLVERVEAEALTLEAALVLALCLRWPGEN